MMSITLILIAALTLGLSGVSSKLPPFYRSPYHFNPGLGKGEKAKPGEFPYQVQILRWSKHNCGGSLTLVNGKQIVLTAANCVVSGMPSNFEVIAGEIKNAEFSRGGQRRGVGRVVVHEDYNFRKEFSNDIAILTLERPFQLNKFIQPIQLPKMYQETEGDLIVTGWGKGGQFGEQSGGYLQKARIPVLPDDVCEEIYSGEDEFIVPHKMICGGSSHKGLTQGICQGDPGGPLKAVRGKYLAGIVSWGYGCAIGQYPGINTEVASYIDWIENKVREM